jgi:hypothetical protein
MSDDPERREWVTRVLGVAFQTGASAKQGMSRTSDIWQVAMKSVSEQLGQLAGTLRGTGIPQLIDLSRDVETFLDQLNAVVVRALLACDQNPADAKARTAALAAISTASTWVSKDRRIKAVDGNLLGVTVTAGATLGVALQQMQKELVVETEVVS